MSPTRRSAGALVVTVATLLAARAPTSLAQSPADRSVLEAFRDSLAGQRDTAALRGLETRLIEVARRDRDNALLHLRLGFLACRLGELGGGRARYEDAAGEFEWATQLEPGWPYPWYGLGLAELALGEHAVIAIENVRQMLGKDFLSKAAAAFARAAEADPGFVAAVVDLANTALAQRVNARVDVARTALRLAAAGPAGASPQVQLARGRLEREAGEADSAVTAFRAALVAGADSGVALLELARSFYFARRPEPGRTAYFAGARVARSSEATALYRSDLAWAAAPAELEQYDSLSAPLARAEWLERFWSRRDFTQAWDRGERVTEHYRRWFYARRNFRLVSRHRHYDITETYRSTQAEIDDRGVIYLRHGEPDDRARFICPPPSGPVGGGEGVCAPNESWRYRRADGDLVFHFAARDDVQDYKLVPSLVDVLGFSAGVRAAGTRDPLVTELYATRIHFGGVYERLGRGMDRTGTALAEERRAGARAIDVGTRSDSYERRYPHDLRLVTSDFVTGDGHAGQTLHVTFAIPAERLESDVAADGVRYPLRFRLKVADGTGRELSALDTVRVFTTRAALARGQYLTGRLALPTAPGMAQYLMVIERPDGAAGEVVRRDSLEVSPLDGRALAVSDLVLGRRGSGLVWTPPGDTVFLNPLGQYPERATVELYYEVYGLAAGREYSTEITLEPAGGRSVMGRIVGLFRGRRAPVRIAFDATADGPVTHERRALALGDLGRGTYVVMVRVTDPESGATLIRRGRVDVVAAPASAVPP